MELSNKRPDTGLLYIILYADYEALGKKYDTLQKEYEELKKKHHDFSFYKLAYLTTKIEADNLRGQVADLLVMCTNLEKREIDEQPTESSESRPDKGR